MATETNSSENSSKSSWWFGYFPFKHGRDSPSDARNTLFVVAALIAAVTFQAGVNPPGGVWQDNSSSGDAGKAILGSDKTKYNAFIFTNTLAFSASISILQGLVINCPFQMEVLIALFSMGLTYAASIGSVDPAGAVKIYYPATAFILPYLFRLALEIIRMHKEI